MSFDLSGKKCPVCHAYLFEDDDVVFCPECGAPHHRDCYNALGHCALEADHGTERQYDKIKPEPDAKAEPRREPAYKAYSAPERDSGTVKCEMCGEEYGREERRCPNCNTPNIKLMAGYENFDFLGGVPSDMELGEGVTADEAKKFVVANTQRYIPKFAAFAAGVKISWNWSAFLFPGTWMLARKMYGAGALITALSVVFTLFTAPFADALRYIDLSAAETQYEIAAAIAEKLPDIGIAVLIAALLGSLLNIALRIFVAIKGDVIYKKHAISTIAEIKKESEDIDEDMRKKGGISLIAMAIGFAASTYLPGFLELFALM